MIGWLDVISLYHDAGEPAVGFATDRHALRLAGKAQLFAHPHPAYDRQFDPLAVGAERACLVGRAEAVAHAFFLEAGIAPALLEERAEGASKVNDGFLRGALGHIEHPWELFAFEAVQLPPQAGI